MFPELLHQSVIELHTATAHHPIIRLPLGRGQREGLKDLLVRAKDPRKNIQQETKNISGPEESKEITAKLQCDILSITGLEWSVPTPIIRNHERTLSPRQRPNDGESGRRTGHLFRG
jgi:hypothetical protein